MYIKNGKNKINCTDFVSNNPNSVLFYLSTEPKLTKTHTTIELYDDSDFMMTSINRNDYKNEKISKFGEEYILTLTNEDELVVSLDDVKANKIKELSEQANDVIFCWSWASRLKCLGSPFISKSKPLIITSICQYLLTHEELSEYMYHADNEDMKLYSRENIFAIRDKMIETITGAVEDYHKKRSIVNSLETIEEINNI